MRAKLASKSLFLFMNNPISSQTNPVIVIFAVIGLLTAFVFAYWGFGLKNGTYQNEFVQPFNQDDYQTFDRGSLQEDPSTLSTSTNSFQFDPVTIPDNYKGLEDFPGDVPTTIAPDETR